MNVSAREKIEPKAVALDWLAAFEKALRTGDAAAATALFLPEGHWRDVLACTWSIQTVSGAEAIEAALGAILTAARPRDFRLPPSRTPPRFVTRAGREIIEVLFAFETAAGPSSGVLRLSSFGDGYRAWILLTSLDEIRGHEEGSHKLAADAYSRDFGGENWQDKRNRAVAYEDREPTVLVVGGGQAGLSIAARLGQAGIDTLIIDRADRVGDNWRKRYHALTLHNEVHVNHLPYMPFPATWPVFIPKDKLANWFEAYAEAMELNFWTGTELIGGAYDDAGGHWRVTVRRNGKERVLQPRHLVFATGVSSIPVKPDLPGLADYKGKVLHSGAYTSGGAWKGKKTLVLGTGNSGHDVAQDLCAAGADVTLIQRSPTYVVSLKEAQKVYSIYAEGIPTADCDLLATAMPYPELVRAYQLSTTGMRKVDAALIDSLTARGFKIDYGEDETGFQMKYLRRGGGYYFNVGCSDMIIDGRVGLIQYTDIDRFMPEGVRMKDGRVMPADLLVLATGYKNQQDVMRTYLGDEIADRVGPVWGFDEGGELRNMWSRTAQKGLWFTAGSLAQCRIYSKVLALQIKAIEEGLIAA